MAHRTDQGEGEMTRRALGPYRLIRRLGAGGMAEVYLAQAFGASGFEKAVALKLLRPELQHNARMQRLLIDEARLGARLSHRNLVGVHDLGVDRGVYFVRLDYIEGTDLGAVLRARGKLSTGVALLVAEELTLALHYLHGAVDERGRPLGLVHRDVSPANVLLSTSGEVKLADLGVAKATQLADITRAGVLKGKYAYMSPEQVAGEPLTANSDQFGLGVTLMEMLCGRRPYDGDSPLQVMERVQRAEPPNLGRLDTDLAALLLRCLARQPEDRFEDDTRLLSALAACRMSRPSNALDLAVIATS